MKIIPENEIFEAGRRLARKEDEMVFKTLFSIIPHRKNRVEIIAEKILKVLK